MVSLPHDIVYHFWPLCDRVIVSTRSGKWSFHDWKGQGKIGKFCYGRPAGTLLDVI